MQLSKKLILFQFILKQFGYDDFMSLRAEFNIRETGSNASGRSYFAGILVNRSKIIIEKHTLFAYDEAIQGYEKKLREHRAEPLFTLKYYHGWPCCSPSIIWIVTQPIKSPLSVTLMRSYSITPISRAWMITPKTT